MKLNISNFKLARLDNLLSLDDIAKHFGTGNFKNISLWLKLKLK